MHKLRLKFNSLLMIILIPIVVLVTVIAFYLYNDFLENKKRTLQQYAFMTSHIISNITQFNKKSIQSDYKIFNNAFKELLASFQKTHKKDPSLEFLLGKRDQNRIIFFAYSHNQPPSVSWSDTSVAVPMRKALQKEFGTIVENDYNRKKVFAAYQYIPNSDWGLVIKQPYTLHLSSFIYTALGYIIVMFLLIVFIFISLYHYQKRTTSYVEHHQERLKDIIESIDNWVWEVNSEGIYTFASGQVKTLLGYTPEEILGKTPFDLMPKEEALRVQKVFSDIVQGQKPIKDLHNINLHKDGYKVHLLTNGVPYFDAQGKLLGYRGIDKDISQEIADQEKMKSQEELLIVQSRLAQMGELISMIAHQWRQPLSAITSVTNLLRLKSDLKTLDDALLNQKILTIENYTAHLSQTIDDFRNFYKISKEAVKISINEPVQDALKIIYDTLSAENTTITQTYESDHELYIYKHEIIQVVLNILKNAQDNFLEKKVLAPHIDIKTYDEENVSVIEISDNGGGIPDSILDKIFDPYFSTKASKNGTGLGMYMSKIIIEDHHKGVLRASNNKDGATFIITLPHHKTSEIT